MPSARSRRGLLTALALALAATPLGGPATATFPGADGPIYYEQGTDIWSVQPDGSGATPVIATPDVGECTPAASHDGSALVYDGCALDGGLYAYSLASGQGLQVNSGDGQDDEWGSFGSPVFSPDGSQIAATAIASFWRRLVVVDVATGAVTPLTPDGYTVDEVAWSVTGEIFHVAEGDLWSVTPGGTPQRLTTAATRPDEITDIDVSPDGQLVAFDAQPDFLSPNEIWVIGRDGTGARSLTAGLGEAMYEPSWSPSGAELVVTGNVEDQNGLFVLSAEGALLRRLASPSPNAVRPYWAVPPGGVPPGGGGAPPPAPPPPPPPGDIDDGPLLDGDPATTERVEQGQPLVAAVEISRRRFADAGAFAQAGASASWVVLSRDDDFPDSLAGSALAGGGPLLLTPTAALDPTTRAEIQRVLAPGGTVYLLGGPNAIGDGVAAALTSAGYAVRRLAGPSRVETAIAVADEVRTVYEGQGTALLARDRGPAGNPTAGWADSVSGGALAAWAGVPVLLTPTDSLHPAVQAWLAADGTQRVPLLGGTAALSTAVEQAVGPAAERIAGAERAETATEIARRLWGVDPTTPGRSFVVIDGQDVQGWAFGLAATGISADASAPLLMVVGDTVPAPTGALVAACGAPQVETVIVGDASVVPASVEAEIDQLDGGAC